MIDNKYKSNVNSLSKLSEQQIKTLSVKNNIPFINKKQVIDVLAFRLMKNVKGHLTIRENDFDLDNIPPPPPLVRQIGEHHWRAGADSLDENPNRRSIIVSRVVNPDNTGWLFVLKRDGNRYIRKTFEIDRDGRRILRDSYVHRH